MGFKNNHSPLRYPGGKASIAFFFESALRRNGVDSSGTYCEPFAGGAGVALTLLFNDKVKNIIINDLDICISAFWQSVLDDSEEFIEKIRRTPVTLEEWDRQRRIYGEADSSDVISSRDRLQVGFSTFFLNRCNRAGILPKAGPIGGRSQSGRYKIDARFKKDVLIERIQRIVERRSSITFTSMDAIAFLQELPALSRNPGNNTFLYLDPPYYHNGRKLYMNFYAHADHLRLARTMSGFDFCPWIMTYDNCQEVKDIYGQFPGMTMSELSMNYSMQKVRSTSEILIVPCPGKSRGTDV